MKLGWMHILPLLVAFAGTAVAAPEPKPAPPTSATSTPAATAAASYQLDGFRSAHFGMSEADVRHAVEADFGKAAAQGIKVGRNLVEGTRVLSLVVPDVLPDGGAAIVSYTFGYKSKKLIEASVVWSTASDKTLTPERLLANGETLRNYLQSQGYVASSVVTNATISDGLLLFRGSDAAGHTTALIIRGKTTVKDKTTSNLSPTALLLIYIADPKTPDIYRVPNGKF